jgi:hypothetical protein
VTEQAFDRALKTDREIGFEHPSLFSKKLCESPIGRARRRTRRPRQYIVFQSDRYLSQQEVLPEALHEVPLRVPCLVTIEQSDEPFEVISLRLDDADKVPPVLSQVPSGLQQGRRLSGTLSTSDDPRVAANDLAVNGSFHPVPIELLRFILSYVLSDVQ